MIGKEKQVFYILRDRSRRVDRARDEMSRAPDAGGEPRRLAPEGQQGGAQMGEGRPPPGTQLRTAGLQMGCTTAYELPEGRQPGRTPLRGRPLARETELREGWGSQSREAAFRGSGGRSSRTRRWGGGLCGSDRAPERPAELRAGTSRLEPPSVINGGKDAQDSS